jgi:hypothetical protein
MAALLDLSANASHTDITCTWDLSDSSFSSVTSMVLTYTDLDSLEWVNVPVSGSTPVEYSEIITDLSANTDYKVYLTVMGRANVAPYAKILRVSQAVIVRTGEPVTRPTIGLLAGKTYLQVLFKESSEDLDPYNFDSVNCNIDGFVVSCNDLTANKEQNEDNEAAAPSARLFSKEDVKTYSFRVGVVDYTYKYVLISDLQSDHLYEVAVTYYTANGIGSVSNTLQRRTLESTETFASYAVNELYGGYVGATPSIRVTWRDPVKSTEDVVADVASRPKTILRQYYDDETEGWVNDVTYTLAVVTDAELLTGFTHNDGHYTGDGSGNFTYSEDSEGLVAGREYQYVITMRDTADTVDITSTTNYLGLADIDGTMTAQWDPVVALQRPTLDMSANALTLNVNTGDFSLNAAFSTIVTNTGGFAESEFNNDDFLLEYSINGGDDWSSQRINIVEGQVSCDNDILREIASTQKEVQFRISAKPMHQTSYMQMQGDTEPTTLDQPADATSSALTGNYDTTLPGDVSGFKYTNVTVANENIADGSITLMWDADDTPLGNKRNDLTLASSHVFYRVVATKQSDPAVSRNFFLAADFTDVASYITLAGTDLSGNYQDHDGAYSYTFNANGAFFAIGDDYKFTIERGYVNLNTIASDPAGVAGANGSELLYGDAAPAESDSDYALRMFTNPPVPDVTDYAFNTSNGEFTFNLAYTFGTYGFDDAGTYFEYSLKNNTQNITETAIESQSTGLKTINMSEIGNVGDSFTLTVREYVDTRYVSDSSGNRKFYSNNVTFEFKKQGPLAQPDSLISYKDTGLNNQDGTQMKIEWALVTDAAATALGVPVYYELTVYDETDEEQVDQYYLLASAPNADMFSADDLAANPVYHTYDLINSDTYGKYIYTGLTKGHYYTYTIVARYYADDFDAYVSSQEKSTDNALLAFGPLPVPAATIDIESIGTFFNFEVAYTAPNISGIPDASLNFEYVKLNAESEVVEGSDVDLSEGENQVSIDSFAGIEKGDTVPVGFRTYFSTLSTSDDNSTQKYTSTVISNYESVNPVTFTYSPQHKIVSISYSDGDCLITATHETNGEPISEVHAVTQSTNVANTSTLLATHYDGAATTSATAGDAEKSGDYVYTLTVPDVKVNGLKFLSLSLHNSSGLDVAQVSADAGLPAGTYILDPANPTIFNFVSQ